MKLMVAMTLAVVAVVSVCVKPAIAEEFDDEGIKGVSYSRSSNVPDLKFNLVFKTSSGEIQDNDNNLFNDSGYFTGAIENFSYFDDAPGSNPSSSPTYRFTFNGDLETMLEGDTVRYTIISPNPFQLTDIREGTIITFPTTISPGPVYTFELNVSGLTTQEKAKYVNDLQFIVRNNLYRQFRSESFVRDRFGFDVRFPGRNSGFEVSTIPEPSTLVAMFALGTLGAGSLLKRKIKKNS